MREEDEEDDEEGRDDGSDSKEDEVKIFVEKVQEPVLPRTRNRPKREA
ncbi:hypothetical protein Patl1_17064 [Pistacia atlantica]|uniref:Uncharacterized protein n=2 Tax=Pistacia TaxID=55512 RepID=A0ACC1B9X9_9ROSI|nr:hypothetical protein Patl1_17064 [Pistacia atlantica]